LAQHIAASQSSTLGWALLIIGTVLIAALVWGVFKAKPGSPLIDVAAGRPILMLIVITATVAFGGMLVFMSLFGNERSDFEMRFQKGREVFLVFSGICATVVGFYFGSGTVSQEAQPKVSVSASLDADGGITASVAGGSPPYAMILMKDGKGLNFVPGDDGATFTLDPNDTDCPADGMYKVTGLDGTSYPETPVSFSAAELNAAGWTACTGDETNGGDADGGGAQQVETNEAAPETPQPTGTPVD
jgi:hypothetical protein